MTQPSGPQGPQYPHNPQQPYGAPGGHPQQAYGPPPKKKSPLPWILAIVGVLVLAGGGVAAWLLLGDDDKGSPEAVADQVVQALNERDTESLLPLGCARQEGEQTFQGGDLTKLDEIVSTRLESAPGIPPAVKDKLKDLRVMFERGQVTENDDTATAEVTIKFENVPPELAQAIESQEQTRTMNLANGDDGWCVQSMGGTA